MAREAKLVVKVHHDILEEIRKEAAKRGVTMSALGAWVISDWIQMQKKLDPLLQGLVNHAGELFEQKRAEILQERP